MPGRVPTWATPLEAKESCIEANEPVFAALQYLSLAAFERDHRSLDASQMNWR